MRNFKKLKIWQNAMEIAASIYNLTDSFPETERFGLSSQMRRSAVSVSSNIAESSSRISEKDKSRFMQMALGSLFELETQILISTKLNFIDSQSSGIILDSVVEEQKMISGFIKQLSLS